MNIKHLPISSTEAKYTQLAISSPFIRVMVMGLVCSVVYGRNKTTSEWKSCVYMTSSMAASITLQEMNNSTQGMT